MTVAELEDLLATLDKDTVVLVKGCHVDYVSKHGKTKWPRTVNRRRCEDCGQGTVREDEMVDIGPTIDLGVTIYAKGRADEAPTVRLYGHWSRAAKELFPHGR